MQATARMASVVSSAVASATRRCPSGCFWQAMSLHSIPARRRLTRDVASQEHLLPTQRTNAMPALCDECACPGFSASSSRRVQSKPRTPGLRLREASWSAGPWSSFGAGSLLPGQAGGFCSRSSLRGRGCVTARLSTQTLRQQAGLRKAGASSSTPGRFA